ncbi:MAG: hypothetical protein IJ013_08340 [Bacteroidaceae bacterium]|nr:hypothetical protein [Bacteroidaceae bacterium]
MEIAIVIVAIVGIVAYLNTRKETKEEVKKEETSDAPVSMIEPDELFKALGVEVKDKQVMDDNNTIGYWVAYQGGNFHFTIKNSSTWVNLHYSNFYYCEIEHLNKALFVANSMNLKYSGWGCNISVSNGEKEERPVYATLCYGFALHERMDNNVQNLKRLMELAFHIARDFSAELDKFIKEQKNIDQPLLTDKAFHNNIARIQWMKTMNKLGEETEENGDSSALSVNRLVKLFDNADFGCLQSLRIVCGEEMETITDITEIEAFDIREYIRQRPDAMSIKSINLTFGFEYQELFVNLTKAKASTDKSLVYVVNIVRSGSELDVHMDNRIPFSSRTMLEVRLTDAEKDYWEAKYMVDEAMDMVKNGRTDELTNEQRLVIAHTDPSIQADLYWGKKFYNNRCYFQALYHFNSVFACLKEFPNDWDDDLHNLYCKICFYIGFIYNDLGMYDRAFYYLFTAQRIRIDGTQEFINCLCNMADVEAKGYIHDRAEEVMKQMRKSEEEAERLAPHYNFLRRRYAYVLIDRGELDDAEQMLNSMIADEEDVEYAKGELEYIKEIRRSAEEEAQTEEGEGDK